MWLFEKHKSAAADKPHHPQGHTPCPHSPAPFLCPNPLKWTHLPHCRGHTHSTNTGPPLAYAQPLTQPQNFQSPHLCGTTSCLVGSLLVEASS